MYLTANIVVASEGRRVHVTAYKHTSRDSITTTEKKNCGSQRMPPRPIQTSRYSRRTWMPPASAATRRLDLRQNTADTTSSTRVAHRCCCPPAAHVHASSELFVPTPAAGAPSHRPRTASYSSLWPVTTPCHGATLESVRRQHVQHVTTTGASGVASGCLASTSAMHTRDNTGHCHISASASLFSRTRSRSSKDWGYGARRSALQHGCNYCPQMLPALKNHATEPQ
ncbi:hypothetical protein B0H19DRAFT_1076035 [Mycena capillaripes]|nr:hypothetical protein B0H19DRAFT_1076034 [Mycena capillaripes]KAJ6545776.1 hypothetical protein B0H19DRAFT_1076035 [Mycena capillaripes]